MVFVVMVNSIIVGRSQGQKGLNRKG